MSQNIKVFHGTSLAKARKIQSQGLKSHRGYEHPSWYMVSEDFDSAVFHSKSIDLQGAVVEFIIPTENKKLPNGRTRKMWTGYPYLWKAENIKWEGKTTKWWALRRPLNGMFVKKIHKLSKMKEDKMNSLRQRGYLTERRQRKPAKLGTIYTSKASIVIMAPSGDDRLVWKPLVANITDTPNQILLQLKKLKKKYEIGKLWVVDDFGDKTLATVWLRKHKRKL